MTFSVKPATLRESGARLRVLGDDTGEADAYAGTHLDLPRADSGIYQQMTGAIDGVREQIQSALGSMRTVLASSGTELRQVAHLYETTDRDEAARYDAKIADVVDPPPDYGPK